MSSNDLSKAEQNFFCFVKACVDLIKLPLIDILTDQINPKDLYNKIGSCTDLLTGKYKLLQFQSSLCYLSPPDVPDYKSFDVTLLYKLIINLSSLKPPTKGWFKKPEAKDTTIGADIERLRLLKNSYSHDDSTEFPDIEFQKVWKDLKNVIQRFQKEKWRKYDYEDELEKIERIKFGYEDRDQCKLYLKATLNLWEQLNHKDEPEIMIKGKNNVLFGDKARFDVLIKNTENNSNWLVTWQKKTGDVIKILRTSDEKYKESTNRRLCIWSVCKEDEAEYQAVIYTGEKSSIFSNSIHLHGLGDMPFFSVWDIKTDKKELTIIYEYGVTQSSPQVFEVKWAKNGNPLNWENNRYLGGSLNDKYLTITSPTSDGKGTYSCTVTNAVGSVSKDFPFDVPNATILTDNSEVVFGSETKVESLVESCPKPDGVEWQKSKDGKNFLGIDINKPHYHGSSLNSESPLLLISKTVFEDVLYYRLHVWNKIGEHFSDPLFLDVKGSPPNITSSHETDIEKRSVKLVGKVFLYDQSHEILDVYWSIGENKIDTFDGGNKYSKVSTKEPSLTIFNVNEHDAGSYQLTATNAVGATKSHVIVLDKPQISFERRENTDKSLVFNAIIQSIPAAYRAQWKMKGKDEDTFIAIKSNTKEYLEISNSLPQPVLVIKQRELLESKCFLIEVYNFLGKNVKEILCNEVSETSIKTEGDILSDIFNTKGSKIRFNNLRLKLIESLAEKDLQNLKESLEVLTPIGKEFRDVNSKSDFISRLWGRGVITERNVIIMQYLMRSLKRLDLEQMLVKYATKDNQALCYFEDPLNQDGPKVSLHVVDDIENFTTMEALRQTVADIVDCKLTDIQVIALQPENSFIIVMTMREDLVRKLKETFPKKLRKLSLFKVDWIRIDDKVINIVEEDPCCLIRKSFVPLKESLLTYPTLIDKLKACSVLSDEEKADYKVVDGKKCGILLKKIIKKGVRACASFLSHVNNSEYRDLQILFHPLPLEVDAISFQREWMKKYRHFLIDELEPTTIIDYLFQYEVFDIHTHDEIEQLHSRVEKTQQVLNHLEDMSNQSFNTFMRILRLSSQGYIFHEIEKRENEPFISKDLMVECVTINFRRIRDSLHFEITVDFLQQEGIIDLGQRPEKNRIWRGKLVKESIKKGAEGCSILMRCLEFQDRNIYDDCLMTWRKKRREDPITHIKTRITKTDLTKLNCFLVYEMEPLQTSDILFEENVLTVNEHDIIEGIKSLRQRNEQLLSLLHGKSQDQLDRFAYTLYEKDFIREYIRDILTQDEEQKPEKSNFLNIDPTCKSKIVLQGSYGTSTIQAATRNDQLCPSSDYDTERILSKAGGMEQNMADQLFPSSRSHDHLGKQEEVK